MKFSKVLASVAAATVAVSTLAVSAFAADPLLSATVDESGKPVGAKWELTFDDTVASWAGNVDKIVVTVTGQAYVNGALGGNTVANDGLAASAQLESKEAGTNEWTWDSVGGLKAGKDGEGNETGYLQAEIWWMNAQEDGSAATATFDKIDFFDKDGKLLATYPAAEEVKPGETEDPTKPGETEDSTKPGETEDPTKPGETEDPTKPGETEDPTKPGETEVPAEPGTSSGDVNPGECSGDPVNPPTGAAVAVIPAVLAAAAVATTGIVLKKRSK